MVLQNLIKRHGGCNIEVEAITMSPEETQESEDAKLRKAAQPLVEYLRLHCDSQTTVLVENDFVRIVKDGLGQAYPLVLAKAWEPKIKSELVTDL